MPARRVALDGTADIPLADVLTVVGRHRECDVRLGSSRVSRRHCCLVLRGDAVLVRDLGSTNGVSINGLRVDMGLLGHGDLLAIAHLRFRLWLQAHDGAGIAGDAAGDHGPPPAGTAHETVFDPMPPAGRPPDASGP